MRLLWSAAVIAAAASSASAFAPVSNGAALTRSGVAMSAVATADVKAKQDASIEKLKAKDASSAALSKDEVIPYAHKSAIGNQKTCIHGQLLVAVAFERWPLTKTSEHVGKKNTFQPLK
eukprot:CAMPEP_0113402318 /NCGR_PEP_ID=MMETSP0013_2-20120614/17192_1 /TAXON_ID=2843 ORGANISM="Skeletonema costatum, Strain 1716" /NCGR_SAMPLE_ID=MMETSP0013_2 /ASSEMBLY_ACC=CAM_ASM_000158 /LENGTH=118 /DNA_ID=CAMNT_0000287645 /DNA_START=110 /DNA_END=467 /DNA_ORIENTATION=- /assembly_acc=CAM_ASM_000158